MPEAEVPVVAAVPAVLSTVRAVGARVTRGRKLFVVLSRWSHWVYGGRAGRWSEAIFALLSRLCYQGRGAEIWTVVHKGTPGFRESDM